MTPHWHNAFPFHLVDTGAKVPGFPPYRRRCLYEYTADPVHPATFQVGPQAFIRPDKHCFLDMASNPEILQPFVPKDLHNPSFCMHDCACAFHGLWFSQTLDGVYMFFPVSSSTAHELLGMSLESAGYSARGPVVQWAVSTFGPRWRIGDVAPGDGEWRHLVNRHRRQAAITPC